MVRIFPRAVERDHDVTLTLGEIRHILEQFPEVSPKVRALIIAAVFQRIRERTDR